MRSDTMTPERSPNNDLERHIGVYVDIRTMEGKDLLAALDERRITYVYVPTHGTPPKLQCGMRRIWGVEKILEYVDSAQHKNK